MTVPQLLSIIEFLSTIRNRLRKYEFLRLSIKRAFYQNEIRDVQTVRLALLALVNGHHSRMQRERGANEKSRRSHHHRGLMGQNK